MLNKRLINIKLNKHFIKSYLPKLQFIVKYNYSFTNTNNNPISKEDRAFNKVSIFQKLNHFRNSIFSSIFTIGLAINGTIY